VIRFGPGSLNQLGPLARSFSFGRTLLVADSGMVQCSFVERTRRLLEAAGVSVTCFHEFTENPHSGQVEAGAAFASGLSIDSIIGLGGGSSMDCAKGINFVLTNGGCMKDYWGYGKTSKPMLPMIGIPTSTGTGSEAQSYALISDAETHVKMACGDPGAAFRAVLLDAELTLTQPRGVLAATGFDAISHAVETWVTTKRNALSDAYSLEAWRLLSANFEKLLAQPSDIEAATNMQAGANLAGAAIEQSMLGAAHACANPITARFGITHGVAIAIMLPYVVGWNGCERYQELHCDLAMRLDELAMAAGLPRHLHDVGVSQADLAPLAEDAAKQWTGKHNPRAFDAASALELYQCAF